jgi:hypothetical protein
MSVFWTQRPTVLFDKEHALQMWPMPEMSMDEQFNALTRLVIMLGIFGAIVRRSPTPLGISVAILIALVVFHRLLGKREEAFTSAKVGISGDGSNDTLSLRNVLRDEFHPTTRKNPMGNVLLTDISDDPERRAAAPSFNPTVADDITQAVQRQTQMLNPNTPDMTSLVYGDLKDKYDLDKSMQRFYTTSNTRVGNNQGAYAQYLYGDMHSSKEPGIEGAIMREKNNLRYIP